MTSVFIRERRGTFRHTDTHRGDPHGEKATWRQRLRSE